MSSLHDLYDSKYQAVKGLLFSSLGIGLSVAGIGTGIGLYLSLRTAERLELSLRTAERLELSLRTAERLEKWGRRPGEPKGKLWSKFVCAAAIIFCTALSYSSYRLISNFVAYWGASNDIEASMCQMWERRRRT